MNLIQNYAYKVSAFMSGGMMVKVCVQGHVPSWFVNEDQQANLWKLFGWAHLFRILFATSMYLFHVDLRNYVIFQNDWDQRVCLLVTVARRRRTETL